MAHCGLQDRGHQTADAAGDLVSHTQIGRSLQTHRHITLAYTLLGRG
jgi:hypothetical protein